MRVPSESIDIPTFLICPEDNVNRTGSPATAPTPVIVEEQVMLLPEEAGKVTVPPVKKGSVFDIGGIVTYLPVIGSKGFMVPMFRTRSGVLVSVILRGISSWFIGTQVPLLYILRVASL
jgi:hypothetical protein